MHRPRLSSVASVLPTENRDPASLLPMPDIPAKGSALNETVAVSRYSLNRRMRQYPRIAGGYFPTDQIDQSSTCHCRASANAHALPFTHLYLQSSSSPPHSGEMPEPCMHLASMNACRSEYLGRVRARRRTFPILTPGAELLRTLLLLTTLDVLVVGFQSCLSLLLENALRSGQAPRRCSLEHVSGVSPRSRRSVHEAMLSGPCADGSNSAGMSGHRAGRV